MLLIVGSVGVGAVALVWAAAEKKKREAAAQVAPPQAQPAVMPQQEVLPPGVPPPVSEPPGVDDVVDWLQDGVSGLLPGPAGDVAGAVMTLTSDLGQMITGNEGGALAGLTGPVVGLSGALGSRVGEELADLVGIEGAGRQAAQGGGAAVGVAGAVLGAGALLGAATLLPVVVGAAELVEFLTSGDGYGAVGPGHAVGSRAQQGRNNRMN
jgi:hypothetical protein